MSEHIGEYSSYYRRAKRFLFTDSGIFFILGTSFILKGISYIPEGRSSFYEHPFEQLLNNDVFAVIWISIGVLLYSAMICTRTLYTSTVFSLSMTFLVVWGLGFSLAGSFHIGQFGFSYGTLAIMSIYAVLRGRRNQIRVVKEV